ncbi:hypothetical protein ASG65_21165 [Bacillus sp. Leaf13]|nr:hypothetical protein ASG65_21165 [Bacillus sp. Leaf13]KRF64687.1 hypothetical protein ASG99_19815 [Bacillus sp. Soil768D1]
MKKTKPWFRFFVLSEFRIIMSLTYLFLLLKQGKLHIECFIRDIIMVVSFFKYCVYGSQDKTREHFPNR